MFASEANPHPGVSSHSFGNLAALKGNTKEKWMSPFSQCFTIQEATQEQSRYVDEELCGKASGFCHESECSANARRRYLREHLALIRHNRKVLVMIPRRCPDTLDEIYCSVSLRRCDALVVGGGKGPRQITAHLVNGVVVPVNLRLNWYATAMLRRIIGDKHAADPDTVFTRDLKEWLGTHRPEILFTGLYVQKSASAHLWTKYGAASEGFHAWMKCESAQRLDSTNFLSLTTHRGLTSQESHDAIVLHNTLQTQEWFKEYSAGELAMTECRVKLLAPANEYTCRVKLREWFATQLNRVTPSVWGFELYDREDARWSYIAFIHCLEDRKIQILSYRSTSAAAFHALLYLTSTSDDIHNIYKLDIMFLRPVSQQQISDSPGMDVMEFEPVKHHRVAMIINQDPELVIEEVGQHQFEHDPRYL